MVVGHVCQLGMEKVVQQSVSLSFKEALSPFTLHLLTASRTPLEFLPTSFVVCIALKKNQINHTIFVHAAETTVPKGAPFMLKITHLLWSLNENMSDKNVFTLQAILLFYHVLKGRTKIMSQIRKYMPFLISKSIKILLL